MPVSKLCTVFIIIRFMFCNLKKNRSGMRRKSTLKEEKLRTKSASTSAILGSVLILFSMITKVPQIVKIHQNKSGEGLNLFSVTLDLFSITISMAYNYIKQYPFTSWGETAFLSIQTLIIGAQILFYESTKLLTACYVASYSWLCYMFMSGNVPISVLTTLHSVNIIIFLTSRCLQIKTNYDNGSTGQMSAITPTMCLFGSLVRIYTSQQETKDALAIFSHSLGAMANLIIFGQLLYYWNVSDVKTE